MVTPTIHLGHAAGRARRHARVLSCAHRPMSSGMKPASWRRDPVASDIFGYGTTGLAGFAANCPAATIGMANSVKQITNRHTRPLGTRLT